MAAERQRVLHTVDTIVARLTEEAATKIHAQLATNAERLVEQHPDLGSITSEEWRELYLPAMLWKMYAQLAVKIDKSADGWAEIFHANLNERNP